MACAMARRTPSRPPFSRSSSTPDVVAALMCTARPERAHIAAVQTLDMAGLGASTSSRRHSVNSSDDNAVSPASSQERAHSRSNELTVPSIDGQVNGSLISFGNVQLMSSNQNLNEDVFATGPRLSLGSDQSDCHRHLLSFHQVGRTLQKTHSHLKRTRLLHVFYVLALPLYTLIGAVIFHALDGEHDQTVAEVYKLRCQTDRSRKLEEFEALCASSGADCFAGFRTYLDAVDRCYREWQMTNRTATHPMSDFTNAIVYAFSVYTSIGYGTVSASTVSARVATVIYAAFGIPLFFAFVKEEGNQCRIWFIRVYNYLKRWNRKHLRRKCCWGRSSDEKNKSETDSLTAKKNEDFEIGHNVSPYHVSPLYETQYISPSDQRLVFVASVLVFIVYLLLASYIYSVMAQWDYFTSFYFTFSSVALIGFGDVYPNNPRIILANMVFIVIGVVLFSMSYFILQEEIRVKAFEASRRARMSISKYSHSLLLHTKPPWSRRNSPAFDQSSSNNSSKFERHRKRRQSAPAITVQMDR